MRRQKSNGRILEFILHYLGGVYSISVTIHFVFAYLLDGPPDRWPAVRPHVFREEYYAFLVVTLAEYQEHCRPRSASWDTVSVGTATFRRIARPVEVFGISTG